MSSADPRDPIYGQPYVGTPVQQASRNGVVSNVLDMYANKVVLVTQSTTDNHYLPNGNLYHE